MYYWLVTTTAIYIRIEVTRASYSKHYQTKDTLKYQWPSYLISGSCLTSCSITLEGLSEPFFPTLETPSSHALQPIAVQESTSET